MEITEEQQLLQTIVHNAWEDSSFKEELIANPIATIENLTGKTVNLPKGKSIIVRDQTDDSIIYINIPAKPNMDNIELNEDQLERIAGGTNSHPIIQEAALIASLIDLNLG